MDRYAVIVPVYNGQSVIRKCLNSILNQKYINDLFEISIYVIDDGSTDKTKEIILEMIKEHNSIKYVYQPNAGVSAARNQGIKLIENEKFCVFVDADDWLDERFFENAINQKADFIYFDWYELIQKGQKEVMRYNSINRIGSSSWSVENLKLHFSRYRNGGAPWAKVFKVDIIRKYGLAFDERLPYAEDYIFIIEYLFCCSTVQHICVPVYYYNCIEEGAAIKYRENFLDILIVIEEKKRRLFTDEKYFCLINSQTIEELSYAIRNTMNAKMPKDVKKKVRKQIIEYMHNKELGAYSIIQSNACVRSKLEIMIFILFNSGRKVK